MTDNIIRRELSYVVSSLLRRMFRHALVTGLLSSPSGC
jgi:hypothetical protein